MAIAALRRRLLTSPSQPFFTHYDGDVRIELSAVTFANWVDKTCNLLEDMGVEAGEAVQLDLAGSRPDHWVTMVWVAACWQRGCAVSLTPDPTAVLKVTGPMAEAGSVPTIACSLHPLGLGFDAVPAGCTDYAEVLSQPDDHVGNRFDPEGIAVTPHLSFRQVRETRPRSGRLLVTSPDPGWGSIANLLVAPLLGGGSTVVAMTSDPQQLRRIIVQEKAGVA